MDLKSFIALGRLTVADIELKDQLIKDLLSFNFVESESGGFKIANTGAGHDDLCMALAVGIVPLLKQGILERKGVVVMPNILQAGGASYYTGNFSHLGLDCRHPDGSPVKEEEKKQPENVLDPEKIRRELNKGAGMA